MPPKRSKFWNIEKKLERYIQADWETFKTSWADANFCQLHIQVYFGYTKCWNQQKHLVQNNFGSQKMLGQIEFGFKRFLQKSGSKKFLSLKTFYVQKNCGSKKRFGSKRFWGRKRIWSKIILSLKYFWSKKCWVQKSL